MPTRLFSLGGLVGLLAALSACGGTHAKRASSSHVPAVPATVRSATCADWRGFKTTERRALVAGLRVFFTQPLDSGAHERVPSDARAFAILSNDCRLRLARSFLLYRLYGNAAAFSGTQ